MTVTKKIKSVYNISPADIRSLFFLFLDFIILSSKKLYNILFILLLLFKLNRREKEKYSAC